MTYPEITRNPLQAETTLSTDARHLLELNRGWYRQWYDSIEGKSVDTMRGDFRLDSYARRAGDACRDLLAKGFVQREDYGPGCYGHTTYRFVTN
tara:strand:+ start:61 stop:342 length:282 start_codon:yes stop_codon:yes gene_type:complete